MTMSFFASKPNLYGAPDERERHRLELMIATARGFLAAVAMLAITVDPSEPTRYAEFAYDLLLFYDLHSFAVLLLLKFGPARTARLGPLLHAIDLGWAVSITFLTEGPNSSYFALFVFVLLAAATRWGFRETLLTGAVATFLFLFEIVAASLGMVTTIIDLNSLIMRGAYFLLATFLLAYLSEQAKSLRAGGSVINELTSRLSVRERLSVNMRMVLEELLRLAGSPKAIVVLTETSTGRVVLWEAMRVSRDFTDVRMSDLPGERRNDYLFPVQTGITAWEAHKTERSKNQLRWLALAEGGTRVRHARIPIPPTLENGLWTTMLCVAIGFTDDWNGRLFLIDPTARPLGERRLRFLQTIVTHVTPVFQNVYLLRRLRLRISALERARVARELHDSVLQSLTSIEMQLDVARRDATVSSRTATELQHIQSLLNREILNIRDLMEQLRPRVIDTTHLIERLTDLADRVRRETGIEVRFDADIAHVDVPPELCHELTRIVQEALINVRKHSGASLVQVTLRVDDWAWKLTVKDNGRGSGFVGALSHAELASKRVGPRTIRERVEAVGGKLQVQSSAAGYQLDMIGRLQKPWILSPSA
jgi:signal transduction histidine kinase